MTDRRITLVGICLFLALVILTLFKFFMSSPRSSPNSNFTQMNDLSPKVVDPTDPSGPTLDKDQYQNLVLWEMTERKIGLKRTPVPVVRGEASINVELVVQDSCTPGDADAIELDLKMVPSHKILVSVEHLSDINKSLHWNVPYDFLKTGNIKHQFTLPVDEKPTQYGFFLCTANGSDTSCRSKTVRDFNEIFTEHLKKDPGAGQELRTLFFQYFFLDGRGLTAFSGFPKAEKFAALKTYLRERKAVGGDLEEGIQSVQNNMQTLRSLPFNFRNSSIRIELPKYNVKTCGEDIK